MSAASHSSLYIVSLQRLQRDTPAIEEVQRGVDVTLSLAEGERLVPR